MGSSIGARQSLSFHHVENARDYWMSVVNSIPGEDSVPNFDLRHARALYYLSRLRYLEWHAARQYWASAYSGPALGRSASYEERLAKYESRCQQYEQDVDRYNHEALAVHEMRLDTAVDLAARERQLRIEYESLRRLGRRLKTEQEAKTVSLAQLSGRATRDLSQLLHEARALAERSSNGLLALKAGPIDNYDPSIHYLALINLVEVLYAQLVTASWNESSGPSATDTDRATLIAAIDALESAADLISHPVPTKLGAHVDLPFFIRSFEKVPSDVLRSALETHVRARGDRAPPDALDRLRLLADKPKLE
jgi:hypothetical protein